MALKERLEQACKADPSILATSSDVGEHPGQPLEYLESLGLTKADLKRMERSGLAIRGRTNDPAGSRVRWIIYIPTTYGEV